MCATALAVVRLPATSHRVYTEVVTFKRGSSEISKADRETLTALFQTIKDKSQKVEQAHVAVWSDESLGSRSASARSLADARISVLEHILEGDLGLSNVEAYNMASRANWFARAWSLSPHEVKTLFSAKGAPQNVTPEDFAGLKDRGGPSKAVMLIEIEGGGSGD